MKASEEPEAKRKGILRDPWKAKRLYWPYRAAGRWGVDKAKKIMALNGLTLLNRYIRPDHLGSKVNSHERFKGHWAADQDEMEAILKGKKIKSRAKGD